MRNKTTAGEVAALFEVPTSNVQKLYADNAQDLRAFAARAGAGKYRGRTAREWTAFAEHAEKQARTNIPKPALAAGVIYSGDNGRLICVHCAGMSAKFTGRDMSGHRVTALNQSDADEWKRVFDEDMECEGGCTKHPAANGVSYSAESAVALFGMEVK